MVEEEDKLNAVVIALEDKALNWYQWWEEQNTELTWENFKAAVIRRFQPGLVQNPFGPLLSIKQTSTVMKYREKFERESAPLKKEERIMLKGIFINGLKEEIQAELKLHAAGTLDELMDRALLLEEKNNALRKGGLMSTEKKGGEKSHVKSTKGFTRWEKGGKEGSSSKGMENEASEKKNMAGGKLSQNELRERSRKGLCFKCGENWGRDHICKLKHYKFVLLEESQREESDGGVGEEEDPAESLSVKVLQLSLRSKEGLTSNRSFKVVGRIGGVEVLILVDCGASANFISKRLVELLQLAVNGTTEFEVEVGNGEKVRNRGVCQHLEVEVQGVSIVQHFFIMELGGTDIVLGMDWLASLGEVKANFKNLELT